MYLIYSIFKKDSWIPKLGMPVIHLPFVFSSISIWLTARREAVLNTMAPPARVWDVRLGRWIAHIEKMAAKKMVATGKSVKIVEIKRSRHVKTIFDMTKTTFYPPWDQIC